ncbi:MAG: DNA-directed RNA polymerase subunit omega [Nitrospiraceae bacterium]|jgi:DNA-directed RNA polymerase subunit omega|nr:DNA-directed RNA polymerase subunit omega [Nitrospiraceae bacterium]
MDIITLPIEYDKKKIESKYRLAVIASQRARELALGSDPKLTKKAKKVTTSALLETISGEVKFITGDEAAAAREKADRIDFKKLIEERRKTSAGDLSELEKDLKIYLHEREGASEHALDELFTDSEEIEEGDESV